MAFYYFCTLMHASVEWLHSHQHICTIFDCSCSSLNPKQNTYCMLLFAAGNARDTEKNVEELADQLLGASRSMPSDLECLGLAELGNTCGLLIKGTHLHRIYVTTSGTDLLSKSQMH
jgi:hypothetical protein